LPGADGFSKLWRLSNRFKPQMAAGERHDRYSGWRRAVRSTIAFAKD
jgi:glycerol kinase